MNRVKNIVKIEIMEESCSLFLGVSQLYRCSNGETVTGLYTAKYYKPDKVYKISNLCFADYCNVFQKPRPSGCQDKGTSEDSLGQHHLQ